MVSRNRKRKLKLWRENPYCYWCGTDVIVHEHNQHESLQNDTATLEHLRSRLTSDRLEENDGITERTVLSCYKCNYERGVQEEKDLGIDELHNRSGHKG